MMVKPLIRVSALFIIGSLFLLFCQVPAPVHKALELKTEKEERALKSIDRLMQQRNYKKAYHYLRLFRNKNLHSPFADDVAYRLAYLHVIADSLNPYFNYHTALIAFRQFCQEFPASNYSSACNNWVKILYLTFDFEKRLNLQQKRCNALQGKVKNLQEEKADLQRMLKDLEQVIKRKN